MGLRSFTSPVYEGQVKVNGGYCPECVSAEESSDFLTRTFEGHHMACQILQNENYTNMNYQVSKQIIYKMFLKNSTNKG